MKKWFFLIFLVGSFYSLEVRCSVKELSNEEKRELPIILCSFPKSGNTWLRYCLEYLTKRPSSYMHFRKNKKLDKVNFDNALGNALDLGTDLSRPYIYKAHHLATQSCGIKDGLLIFLVRDYKDCMVRAFESRYDKTPSLNELMSHLSNDKKYLRFRIKEKPHFSYAPYFTNFQEMEKWDPERVFFIYYEDFIEDSQPILKSLLHFLGEDDSLLDEFMQNYESHKKKSLQFYEKYYPLKKLGHPQIEKSKQSSPKKLSDQEYKQLDEYVIKTYPEIWDKYLKRYTE